MIFTVKLNPTACLSHQGVVELNRGVAGIAAELQEL